MDGAKTLQGHLLVASPHLADPNFFRSVVLLVQHDQDGAFGLILNRPTTRTIGDMLDLISEEQCLRDQRVNHGGPVEGPLTALHANGAFSENEVVPGVFFSASRENLVDLARQSPSERSRFFAGYAGWAGGQLEAELEAGGWLNLAAPAEYVFSDQDEMWKQVVERIGLDILEPTLKTKHFPRDPAAN